MSFAPGGMWRFMMHGPPGTNYPTVRDYPSTETVTPVEQDGKTILTNSIQYLSQQARDGRLYSGMESGATESMDRLDELVESLATSAADLLGHVKLFMAIDRSAKET